MMRSGMAMARCQRAEAAAARAAQAPWRPPARSHHGGAVSVGSDRFRQHRVPPLPPLGMRGVGAARWLTTGVDDHKDKATPSSKFPDRSPLGLTPRRSFASTPPTDGKDEKVRPAEATAAAAAEPEPEPEPVAEKSMFPAFMG